MNNALADMLLQRRAVLQVALKGWRGRRRGRLWGRETGRGRGDDVNMKGTVKGVGVRFWTLFFFLFEEAGDNSFYLYGSSEEAHLEFASLWADPRPAQHDL